ncbi:transcriptional regulator, XRE family [Campylobacter blaseri]|uniref:HTH cro/C1-type domain-containing protein n=1 Tax=Campylobacter blaseri TaxID=2042961 RepID=A0A2P8QZ67_9BACT|nr:helix-turn-helix transcriptional regulator [Campylobacter blaseri]PSM51538.1 hypothetical protein CQ405_07005 [Campylobacter blaseri]PSM53331.1 hypothetical protein CRN67_07010 [Campylobacter blaseri]QKF86624.1 transcriptional regulator, XRE family [Campylobacter blaseri]
MTRKDLINKIQTRRKKLNITIENLSKISHIGTRTLNRFLSGDDVKLSTIEKITQTLGLDFAGNEVVKLKDLMEKRANKKAIFLASLVQGTSSLEMQGLDKDGIENIISNFKQELLNGQYKDKLWVA